MFFSFITELFTPGLWNTIIRTTTTVSVNSTIKQDNQQRNESPGYDFIVL